ncbi:hypothetical protein C8F01DRAFT_1059516 [Mycena amicta]|nr:hypothetical protein C8F01DRAFT_1059516 [Mycena amicta]
MSFSQPVASSENSTENPSASVLRARLVAIDTERTDVHAQIAQLRAHLSELAQGRKAVIEQLKGVTYPILDIPPEVTSQIFAYYAEFMAEKWQSLESAPWVLTHVCRAWRRLALALPEIWSQIFFSRPSSPGIDMLMRTWFERASASPLHVTAPTDAEPRLYSLLTPYSDQFESLSCQIPVPSAGSLDDISGRLQQLRKLSLSIGDTTHGPITLFSEAPALRQLEIIYWASGVSGQIDLPWAQLTEVHFSASSFPHLSTILQTLEKMPQLEVLALSAVEYARPTATIELPRLRTLSCRRNLIAESSLRFLAALRCPALEVLEIRVPMGRHKSLLCSFLDGSTGLRSLSLFQPSADQAIDVARRVAVIESLTLEAMTRPNMLFNAMSSDYQLLPNLAELSIQMAAVEFPYASMLSMLKVRCDVNPVSGAALRRFTYKTPEATSFTTISQEDFDTSIVRKFGCKVNITGHSKVGSGPGGHLLYSLDEVEAEM